MRNQLLTQWRRGLEVGDLVRLVHRPTGRSAVVEVVRTTERMVIVNEFARRSEPIRIMRRDGLNYGGQKVWFIDRP